ncbi:class I adenylate-forming enzyme family protein [Nocardioides daejeonensis]|uniref:class I adenylate-forming enzyme family protein n=1 Tax=Nocardioides daejeonensis TaxID=1046556 RepID=UPI000D74FC18|nr:AMP-binding protein [Nocardioides daejeonensis]
MATLNFTQTLRRQANRRGDHEALVDGDQRWTYAELDAEVDRYAAALLAGGVTADDLVGILARNHASYVLELLALSRIGAVSVPLNWRLHATEQAWIIDQAGISVLLADDDFNDDAEVVAAETGLRLVIGNQTRRVVSGPLLGDLLAGVPAGTRVPDAEKSAGDLHRLLYTSGTTSRPKGVMHTCGNVAANHYAQVLELELTPADRILISAPLFHVSGLEAPGLATFVAGGTMVLCPTFKPEDIAEAVRRERVTGLVLAAQILFGIKEIGRMADLAEVKYLLFAGVAPTVRRQVKELLPAVRLVDTYGMTELTNGACYMDAAHEQEKVGSLGPPVAGVQLRIVDGDFNELPAGEQGEIIVRGLKVSAGYWRDEETTERSRRDGWFLTGDVGYLDEDGYLWFVDRRTDLIKSGGENVATAEIERVLAAHPAVAEVAVIGVPDARWDEVPKAFVIAHGGVLLTEDDLRTHCRANLAKFKVPRDFALVDSLPRNDSGKVLKRVLREDEAKTTGAAR